MSKILGNVVGTPMNPEEVGKKAKLATEDHVKENYLAKSEVPTDEEVIKMLADAGIVEVVTDANGDIFTDCNGDVIAF